MAPPARSSTACLRSNAALIVPRIFEHDLLRKTGTAIRDMI
jgi:hypothetical protein